MATTRVTAYRTAAAQEYAALGAAGAVDLNNWQAGIRALELALEAMRATGAAWRALSPAERSELGREDWLAGQERQRCEASARARLADRQAHIQAARNAHAAAAVRASTCPACFMVKAPVCGC
ncbi:phage terminase Nu1 subunit (DNA packaging protein) [Kitasatospora gansuensis]|uniref:Phage terminase Nu1 subunit (DNA packaging protein) n=1 Tax=Kitasatospora gansuensis TaxID=258050 RepID=A0A7W7SFK0_9ACTN|nr:hypothetical protein [Kitasatospora gansuensis]MBB4949550.1 phage terminase Nu1 subunit (DNA packaging protein) [Kitasatospora gansuensis]